MKDPKYLVNNLSMTGKYILDYREEKLILPSYCDMFAIAIDSDTLPYFKEHHFRDHEHSKK